jgi:hypothetical protein
MGWNSPQRLGIQKKLNNCWRNDLQGKKLITIYTTWKMKLCGAYHVICKWSMNDRKWHPKKEGSKCLF